MAANIRDLGLGLSRCHQTHASTNNGEVVVVAGIRGYTKRSADSDCAVAGEPDHLTERVDVPGRGPVAARVECTLKNSNQLRSLLDCPDRTDVQPFKQMILSAWNSAGSVLARAAGGTECRVIMNESVHFDFAVGWTAPTMGSFKASIIEADRAVYGYENVSAEGCSFMGDTVY
ncbi:hypothetical protein C8Q79DRAFT_925268 [Trametes meyenii]|nr:hypothetical protein C8Q79DRAFT_925268 [Trametes meyenii]